MLHRLLGHWDMIPMNPLEVHMSPAGPCGGISTGAPIIFSLCNIGGFIGGWKRGDTVEIGMLGVHPLGLGHDAGMGRPHVLICPDIAIGGPFSVIQSLIETVKSSVKPHYSAHKTQIKAAGAMLPACTELIPYLGTCSVTFCGFPSAPNLCPIVPSHLSVYTTLTLGDIVGGLVNVVVEQGWSLLSEYTASALLGKLGEGIAIGINRGLAWAAARGLSRSPSLAPIMGGLVEGAPGVADRAISSTGAYSVGPSNIGVLAQRAIDGDGITHDADPEIAAGPFARYRHDNDTGRTEGSGWLVQRANSDATSWASRMWR